ARVAAQTLNPDIAFALEGTPANDLPDPSADPDDSNSVNPSARLGYGPAFTIVDGSMIAEPTLLNFVRRTAEANNIPYQFKSIPGGGTDAGGIHVSNAGIPSGVVSVPCRYIHSPAAYLNRDDYDNALKVLKAILNN